MKKVRHIKATVVFEISLMVDNDTEPEDVFNECKLKIQSEHACIFKSKLIHSAVTIDKKVK